jgi:predicted transcriptional regulator
MLIGKRRSELDIIREILELQSAKTALLRKEVKLNYDQMKKYLLHLEAIGAVTLKRFRNTIQSFQITDVGIAALQQLIRTFELLGLNHSGKDPN